MNFPGHPDDFKYRLDGRRRVKRNRLPVYADGAAMDDHKLCFRYTEDNVVKMYA